MRECVYKVFGVKNEVCDVQVCRIQQVSPKCVCVRRAWAASALCPSSSSLSPGPLSWVSGRAGAGQAGGG